METVQVKSGSRIANMLKLVNCRKRKMLVTIVEPGERETSPGWWDGGSREEQVLVEYRQWSPSGEHMTAKIAPQITNPFDFKIGEGYPKVKIDNEQGLLSVGTFCGKPRIPHLLCTKRFWDNLRAYHTFSDALKYG